MVSKEDFMKVWKDSSRKNILNQFYYDYKTLREQYDNWNELKEWLIQLQKFKGINQQGFSWGVAQEVLDKMLEIESRK